MLLCIGRGVLLKQTTFSTAGFDRYAKTTKRSAFLAEMEQVVPWSELCALVEPFYPRGQTG
jgi:IS5 family transposase